MAHRTSWLGLLDDRQLASRAGHLTAQPCLAISWTGMATSLLDAAAEQGFRVSFLSLSRSLTAGIRATLARRWPRLVAAGIWEAPAVVLDDDERASQLASSVKQAKALFGCLAKPRQERWMAEHGPVSEVRVCGPTIRLPAGRSPA